MLVLIPAIICATENSEFAGGDSTVEDPYQISTKYHLDNVRNYPNANFILTNDIIFEEADFQEGEDFYNEGEGWKAINSINGTFNGNGNYIENLQAEIMLRG